MKRDLQTSANELTSLEPDKGRPFWARGIAILCALCLTAGVLIGYMVLRWRHAERLRREQAAQTPAAKPVPSPEVQLFVDEAMIKGSQAVLAGTLQNISQEKLSDITVELELKRRKDGALETRTLPLEPRDLAPDAQGRYALTVPSGEYRESRVLHIKTSSRAHEVAFKTAPGAQRPPERPQASKTIVVAPSPRRGKGEEFINTPDNPVAVP